MNRLMIGLVVGLALGSLITAWSASKYESSSSDAKSVVGCGAVSSTAINYLKTDADGVLQTR